MKRLALLLFLTLVSCSRPDRSGSLTERYRYDSSGRLVEYTAADGAATRYSYDPAGRLTSASFAGGRVEYGYDATGARAWMKDSTGTTEYYRDALGRVSDVVWRRGRWRLIHYQHDPWGNVTEIRVVNLDATGASAELKALGVAPPRDPKQLEARKQAAGRLAAALAGAAPPVLEYRVRYQHDIQGQVVAIDGGAGRVHYEYKTEQGEVVRRLPNGIATTWKFSSAGLLESVRHTAASGREAAVFHYRYDTSGRLIEAQENLGDRTDTARFERDQRGVLREVGLGGERRLRYEYDALGRPTREGEAQLEWNRRGLVAARRVGNQKASFEYDGRGLPLRARPEGARPGGEAAFRWDGDGRLVSARAGKQDRQFLADPSGATDAAWLEWNSSGALVRSAYTDSGVFAEVDPGGRVEFLLRDGFGRVRLAADTSGQIHGASAPRANRYRLPGGDALVVPADFDPNAISSQGLSLTGDRQSAADVAQVLDQYRVQGRLAFDSAQLDGLAFRQQVQAVYGDFLKSTAKSEFTVVILGIGNDWASAFRKTQTQCPTGDCIFLPAFAGLPKGLQGPGAAWEKLTSAVKLQGRKFDMPGMIEQARVAGKTMHAIVCESGCGLDVQRNAPGLEKYGKAHPGMSLPTIVCVSTSCGSYNAGRLTGAGYPIVIEGADKSGTIPRYLRPAEDYLGPLGRVPVVGALAGVGISVVDSGAFAANQLVHFKGFAEGHGIDANKVAVSPWLHPGAAPPRSMTGADLPRAELPRPCLAGDECGGSSKKAKPILPPGGPPPPWGGGGGGAVATGPASLVPDPGRGLEKQLGGIELAARAEYLGDTGAIYGVTYDPATQQVVLLGDRELQVEGVQLDDLAVALILAYKPNPEPPRFSLDPADPRNPKGKWQKAVYLPENVLAGTRFGNTMFVTDWLMKQYSFGLAVDSDGRITERSYLPGGLEDTFQISFRLPFKTEKESWTRFWIVAEDFKIREDGGAITFETARMGVRAKRQVPDPKCPSGLCDVETEVDAASMQFATLFTKNYDRIAAETPEFARLRELAKAVALANWLKDKGVPVDLTWATQQVNRRSQAVVKVPALEHSKKQESRRQYSEGKNLVTEVHTRSIHVFGGVDLAVRPVRLAGPGVARVAAERTLGALRGAGKNAVFPVAVEGKALQGSVLPVTARGRAVWESARATTLDGAARQLDAAGKVARINYPAGRAIEYAYDSKGVLNSARITEARQMVATHKFGNNGRIVSSEYLDGGKAEYAYDTGGRIARVSASRPDGSQMTGALDRNGSRWSVPHGGGEVRYRFDQAGKLTDIEAGGKPWATVKVESDAVTAQAGPYSERVGYDAAGRISQYTRQGPGLDGSPVRESVDLASLPAREFEPVAETLVPVADGPISLPAGGRITVQAQRQPDFFARLGGKRSSGMTVEVTEHPRVADMVIDAQASSPVLRGAAAPERVIVLNSPQRARELLAQRGPGTEVFIGLDRNLALENAGKLPVLDTQADVAVYLPGKQAAVQDFQALQGIRDTMTGLRFTEDLAPLPGKVVILTGHSSAELKMWVESLGRSGALRGKLVVLNSCHGAMDTAWNSRLIREFGATGVRSYVEEITPQAVKDVMVHFNDLLKAPRSFGETLEQLWNKAVDRALGEAEFQNLKQQIEKLRLGVTQLSMVGPEPRYPGAEWKTRWDPGGSPRATNSKPSWIRKTPTEIFWTVRAG